LRALRYGDEAAWTEAFHCLWPIAVCAARHPSACLTDAEAEEAASEALAQLVSQVSLVGNFEQLKALTTTIAFRKAISIARKKSASKRASGVLSLEDEAHFDEAWLTPDPKTGNVLSDVEAAEMVLLLHQAMGELDAETHALIEEKHVLGATYEELSAKHGIPLGTACAKVARGLRKVRRRLENFPALAKELRAFLR
jgi:DNA-directed RNA polymerase specialized sigma24 family protein